MQELLVLGLLSTMLSGMVGATGQAYVVAYSPVPTTIGIANMSVTLDAGTPQTIPVPIVIREGRYTQDIMVTHGTTSYRLSITVNGKRDWSILWWFLAVPAIVAFSAIRIRIYLPVKI